MPISSSIAESAVIEVMKLRRARKKTDEVDKQGALLFVRKRDFYRTLTLPVAAAKRLLNGGEVERQQISNVRASRPLGQFA